MLVLMNMPTAAARQYHRAHPQRPERTSPRADQAHPTREKPAGSVAVPAGAGRG